MKVDPSRRWQMFTVAGATLALVAGMVSTVPSAYAGGKVQNPDNENQWVSLGMGVQASFNAVEHASANGGSYSNTFNTNSARIYINGKIHKNLGFEFNTECFSCNSNSSNVSPAGSATGATPTISASNIGLLDAIGKFEFNQYVNLWVGRMLVTGERGELNGPFYHAVFEGFKTPISTADFSNTFGTGGGGVYGRSQGATFWGQVDPGFGHLQYSVGVYTGLQSGAQFGPNQQNSVLWAGRLTYNFFNPEKNPGYYTSGTYYGTAGDILAIAVGMNHQKNGAGSFQYQSDFTAFMSDLLFEKPLANNNGVITVNAEFKQWFANVNPLAFTQADNFGLFDGRSYTAYALYLFPNEVGIGRFQPYVRYTDINPNNSAAGHETELGTNYVISGHNARISAFWQSGTSRGAFATYAPGSPTADYNNAFKLALQIQY